MAAATEAEECKNVPDVEATVYHQPADSVGREQLRQLGMSKLHAVLQQSKAGHDPWEYHQPPKQAAGSLETHECHDADVLAMGAWLERYRPLLLAAGFVVSQAGSWVMMKGSLMSMHTPAVLTFLHLLAAVLLQLALTSCGILPGPQVSVAAVKGSAIHTIVSSLQLLLVMWVLEHSSVCLLLCWVTVIPVLMGVTCAADVSKRRLLLPMQGRQVPWLVSAAVGLGLELLLDQHARSPVAFLSLIFWTVVALVDMLWHQVKDDATLGRLVMEPEFLFHARELSDLEDAVNPHTKALITASLPAVPVLVLGLISLEAKDLVEHEPSVPTLQAMMLSCLAFAAVHTLHTLMAGAIKLRQGHLSLLHAVAAIIAVVLELVERPAGWCLLGVALSIGGCLGSQMTAEGSMNMLWFDFQRKA